ncbi:hypothetical protein Cfor_04166, partial [Coptotermes formosanus]
LNTNVLESFVENFAKNSDILANKLKAVADGVIAHDIVPYFTRCSLDIICETGAHVEINAQDGKDNDTLNAITTIIETVAARITKPWLYIEWIFSATKLGNTFQVHHIKTLKDKLQN